jgi:hypothetical protein
VPCSFSLGCALLACRNGPSHVNVGGRSAPGGLCSVGVVQVCARYAMMLPSNAVVVRVLRDLHMTALGSRLMLTCRLILLWILLE